MTGALLNKPRQQHTTTVHPHYSPQSSTVRSQVYKMSTSRQQAKRELMDHTTEFLRVEARQYWQVAGRALPRWNKAQLIDMILDGREGAPTISTPGPGRRRARGTPYSERVDGHGTHIARDRDAGWSRRVGTQVNASGGLSSSFTQATPFGSCTFTNRVHAKHLTEFRAAEAAGTAGITGLMFSTAREVNTGLLTMMQQLTQIAMNPSAARIGE